MAEIKTEVKTYRLEYICERCEKGKLYSTHSKKTLEGKYHHACDTCQKLTWLDKKYPQTIYEPVLRKG